MKHRWTFFSLAFLMMCPLLVMAQEVPREPVDIPQNQGLKPDWVADLEGEPEWVADLDGKPEWVADLVAAGKQHYNDLVVSIEEDPYRNPGRFAEVTGGIPFIDENGDQIADIVQDTEFFLKLGEFIDENQDTIHDPYQTWEMYQALGLKNFVDVDGDGICDNYVKGIAHRENGKVRYEDLDIDISKDPFINPVRFSEISNGIPFVDEDGDGIADVVQDSAVFESLNAGDFIDENGDTIHDPFQTWEMYRELGLKNFVDQDGDGVCDNYLVNSEIP